MLKLITVAEIAEFNASSLTQILINHDEETRKIYDAYEEVLRYQSFNEILRPVVSEITALVNKYRDLNHEAIREWCQKTREFYMYHVFYEEMIYYDNDLETEGHLYLGGCKILVDKKDFEIISIFSEVQNILCWQEFHLPEENRQVSNPGDYYYCAPPGPGELTYLEQVMQALGLE
jgi:hypothetical protein